MKKAFIFTAKFLLVVVVSTKILLCFSLDSFSTYDTFSFITQVTECEMDEEEKSDSESEDEYFLLSGVMYDDAVLRTSSLLIGYSSKTIANLVFEIVPPPPKV